jgi:hypothetical protein
MKPVEFLCLVVFLSTVIACTSKPSLPLSTSGEVDADQEELLKRGHDMVVATKTVLGQNLMQAMEEGGPEYAIAFCHTRALPLTDSMARVYEAAIFRITDQPRNLQNEVNKTQQKYMEVMRAMMAEGKAPPPKWVNEGGKRRAYYPITMEGLCLTCHGVPGKEVADNTWQTIRKLYPHDKATGYQIGDLRGMWLVEF